MLLGVCVRLIVCCAATQRPLSGVAFVLQAVACRSVLQTLRAGYAVPSLASSLSRSRAATACVFDACNAVLRGGVHDRQSLDGVVVVGEPGMFSSIFFWQQYVGFCNGILPTLQSQPIFCFQPLTGQSGAIRDGSALDRDKVRLNV